MGSGRRRFVVFREGGVLAVVMAFAVIVSALAIGYGLRDGRPDRAADSAGTGGPPALDPGPDDTPDPAGGATSAPVRPQSTVGPVATGGPTTGPSTIGTPTRAATRAPTTSGPTGPTPTGPPVFAPITVQAEATGNTRTAGAQPVTCGPCSGGARVGYLAGAAQLLIDVTIPVAGVRTLVVTYEVDGPRTLIVSVNGRAVAAPELTGVGWETPRTYQVMVALPVGPVRIGLGNPTGPAPDVDLVVVR